MNPHWLKSRRWLLALPLVLVAGMISIRLTLPVAAKAHTVDRGPVLKEVRGSGTLESVQEVPLAFKVGGRIRELLVEEGAVLRQGQVLGRLDPADFEAQVLVAQSGRGQAEAAVGRAGAEQEQARATARRAQEDFQRAQRLHQDGILSKADLELFQEKKNVADAILKAMDASGLQASQGAALARGTETIQRLNLSEIQLLSPVDGLLVKRLREPGHIVGAGTPVLTVVSTRKLWIRAWVDETSLGELRVGQPAQVEVRSHPGQAFPGRVDRIGRQADRQTHEVLVDVELLKWPEGFAVGQRAEVRIAVEGKADALRIPASFIDAKSGKVTLQKDGRTQALTVKPGFVGSDFIEIQEGLKAGDQVLLAPEEGQALPARRRVRVVP